MTKALNKLGKLRGRGVDELRVRGGQAFHALAERRGWSSRAKLPADEKLLGLLQSERGISSSQKLLEHFRTRSQPKFFASFCDKKATVSELRRRWPRAESEILSRADRIVAGSFDLLGLHGLNFGQPIDWQLEPLSGKTRAQHSLEQAG